MAEGEKRGEEVPRAAEAALPELAHHELERALRRRVHELSERISMSPGELHVVLELEVDGLRCVMLVEKPAPSHRPLSPREQEIARMVGQG